MAETLHVVTTYVLPSGIGQRQVADGHITARITLGHIYSPGGVLAEMNGEMEGTHFESGSHPVPWVSKLVRDQSAEEAARMPGLKPELREQLAAHIRKSAYYEGGTQ
ncbi:hypothetical protein KM031_02090 [Gemmobacter fulvus]|uniref:Uncharacterized protein n=1 Tax=Gemmobacter fulvus TaxID=2840474 RepID=A0A975S1V9_9RHOB|nr:hypothetical protein [Gemmobacter fulvus]MBT9244920.1 hypothetical protein [Gemmobacter fulvus]QWK90726.1 hypothetical protein KM031_02090 [Gemmobacter fulvus]